MSVASKVMRGLLIVLVSLPLVHQLVYSASPAGVVWMLAGLAVLAGLLLIIPIRAVLRRRFADGPPALAAPALSALVVLAISGGVYAATRPPEPTFGGPPPIALCCPDQVEYSLLVNVDLDLEAETLTVVESGLVHVISAETLADEIVTNPVLETLEPPLVVSGEPTQVDDTTAEVTYQTDRKHTIALPQGLWPLYRDIPITAVAPTLVLDAQYTKIDGTEPTLEAVYKGLDESGDARLVSSDTTTQADSSAVKRSTMPASLMGSVWADYHDDVDWHVQPVGVIRVASAPYRSGFGRILIDIVESRPAIPVAITSLLALLPRKLWSRRDKIVNRVRKRIPGGADEPEAAATPEDRRGYM